MFDPEDDAVVIRGSPDTGTPVFRSSFVEACKFAWSMPAEERAGAYIVVGEMTYALTDLESMRREDEGEI